MHTRDKCQCPSFVSKLQPILDQEISLQNKFSASNNVRHVKALVFPGPYGALGFHKRDMYPTRAP